MTFSRTARHENERQNCFIFDTLLLALCARHLYRWCVYRVKLLTRHKRVLLYCVHTQLCAMQRQNETCLCLLWNVRAAQTEILLERFHFNLLIIFSLSALIKPFSFRKFCEKILFICVPKFGSVQMKMKWKLCVIYSATQCIEIERKVSRNESRNIDISTAILNWEFLWEMYTACISSVVLVVVVVASLVVRLNIVFMRFCLIFVGFIWIDLVQQICRIARGRNYRDYS